MQLLREHWNNLVAPYGVETEAAERIFNEIVAAYSSEGRFYHTLAHIRHVLQTLEILHKKYSVLDMGSSRAESSPTITEVATTGFAAWFHDVVYDTKASDNEEQSAKYAEKVLPELNVPTEIIAVTTKIILNTKTHQADDFASKIFLDADLGILGIDSQKYQEYAKAIRQEYVWVPEQDYRAGRKLVLQNFLRREWIYFTDFMFKHYEAQARRNLEREIGSL